MGSSRRTNFALTFAAIGAYGLPLLSSWNERLLESSFDLYLERHALQTTVMSFVLLALGLGIAIPIGIGLSQSGRWASPAVLASIPN